MSETSLVESRIVEAALDDSIEPAVADIAGNDAWSAELAVDLAHAKGEVYVVHRLFHALRGRGVECRLEDRRCDLVVEHLGSDVKIEAKAVHAHQLLSTQRADRGFRSFDHRTKDLEALRAGRADLLLGIVPRFRSGPHLKYPRQIGVHELEPFGLVEEDGQSTVLVAEATRLAQTYAIDNDIWLWRRLPLDVRSPDGWWVEVTLFWFGRRPDD
ncbi:MAG: hypothetical protein KDB37_04540 [Ilumatobacter sp.]|nr:hypothetical protein [Ilumatobacter sp.]